MQVWSKDIQGLISQPPVCFSKGAPWLNEKKRSGISCPTCSTWKDLYFRCYLGHVAWVGDGKDGKDVEKKTGAQTGCEAPRRWLDCFKFNPAGGNVWYVSISCTRCKVHSMHLQCVGQLPPYKLATEVTTPSLWTRPFWKIPPSLIPPSSPSRGLLLAIAMPIVTVDRCYRQWTCTNKALVHVYGFFIWWIYALQICLGFFPVAKEWVMGEGWVIRF